LDTSERFDVAVVGGGCAGVAAALSAAGAGARTLLAERSDVLGGNAALAFVHTICGLYLAADAGDAVAAHPGLPARFARGLASRGGAGSPERAGRVWFLPTDPPRLADYARELCEAAPQLALRLGAELVAAAAPASAGAPFVLELEGRRGRERVAATVAIDASGDAALAALAGAPLDLSPPEALQSPSYIVRLAGVDTRALEPFARLRASHAVAGAVRGGALPRECESVLVRPLGEPRAGGEAFLQVNVPKLEGRPYAPLDAGYRESLEARGRASAEAVVAHLAATRAEFRGARISAFPRRIGVRETRRVQGDVVVTREDVLAGRRREDEVAVSSWPIELWRDHRRAHFEHPQGPSSIPLGALVAAGLSGLGVAGRCASASHEAMGALRVLGTALAMGEAIGTAAALAAAARCELRAIAPAAVRAHILARGDGA
jgi:FAD dependent oxidoreductase